MRDRKRLFIAIAVSNEVKDFFRYFKDKWYDFPGRWTQVDNLHITLSFLGNVREEDIPILIDGVAEIVQNHNPFSLKIEKMDFEKDFNPKEKLPRMIWARVGESEGLSALHKDITLKLNDLPVDIHVQRPQLSAHITLCRFNSISLQKWHNDELPSVAEEVNISFPVESIYLMESKLRRGGPEYFVLQSFLLGA